MAPERIICPSLGSGALVAALRGLTPARELAMDPLACWVRICGHMTAGECEEALWAIDDLCEWLTKGGYRPEGVPFPMELRTTQRVLEAVVRQCNLHV